MSHSDSVYIFFILKLLTLIIIQECVLGLYLEVDPFSCRVTCVGGPNIKICRVVTGQHCVCLSLRLLRLWIKECLYDSAALFQC